jgi:hypothetical protein
VAAILAQMNRNAVCAGQLALHRRPDGVRLVGQPGLPYRGNMIDIDV